MRYKCTSADTPCFPHLGKDYLMFGRIVRVKGYPPQPVAGIAQGEVQSNGDLAIAYLVKDSGRIVPRLEFVPRCAEFGSSIC